MSHVRILPTQMPRYWKLEDTQRPWTTNAERTWHHMKRARMVRDTRETFGWLARAEKIPRLDAIKVAAVPLLVDGRGRQDVGACFPAVKAAIDGLVDAGVIPDDDPTHVHQICFHAPQVVGHNGLRLVVTEVFPSG